MAAKTKKTSKTEPTLYLGNVNFDKDWSVVDIKGREEYSPFIKVPITRDGLVSVLSLVEAILRENEIKKQTRSYKVLEEFSKRLLQVHDCVFQGKPYSANGKDSFL